MTQREKSLMKGLVVLAALASGGGLVYMFAAGPFLQASARVVGAQKALDLKTAEVEAEQAQETAMLKVDPRIGQWKQISLSPVPAGLRPGAKPTPPELAKHQMLLQGDYQTYLRDLMSKYKLGAIKIEAKQLEKQAVAKGAKLPVYEKISFVASGQGDLTKITRMLEEFHRTPLLHEMHNLWVELPKDKKAPVGELVVKMNVEALLVTGAKERGTLMPPKIDYRILAEPSRKYDQMSDKNMFFGVKPKKETPPPVKHDEVLPRPYVDEAKETPKPKTEERGEVLPFVKLTTLWWNADRRRWEGAIWDQNQGRDETRLNTGLQSSLTIRDRYKNKMIDGKVVYVDAGQLIFVDSKKHYRVRCGENLLTAVKHPLTADELDELGLEP